MSLFDDTATSISANGFGAADLAMIQLAMTLAGQLDACLEMGDLEMVAKLTPRYHAALVELQLSPASRKQGEQQEGRNGSDHIEGYLRLVDPKTSHPAAKPSNRGKGGQRPSK